MQDLLSLLEKHVNDKDIQAEIKSEQEEIPYVKASTGRLERDVYDKLIVGDYHERTRNRTAVAEKQRKQYEVCSLFMGYSGVCMVREHKGRKAELVVKLRRYEIHDSCTL